MRLLANLSAISLALLCFTLPVCAQIVGNPMSRRPLPDPAVRSVDLPPSKQVPAHDASRATPDLSKAQEDATQLADIAKSIPADVNEINRGLLPKDVIEKLKRIEKLSRRLRNELTP